MSSLNQQVILVSRPQYSVVPENFNLIDSPVPVARDGEILVRNHWLSLDPYMRGRIAQGKSYASAVDIGAVMVGDTAGVVVQSKHSDFKVGDRVIGALGWQRFAVAQASSLRKVDARLPLSASLGVAGMPGVTAYVGLFDICQPKAGETVLVTAASGAVGSVVGQLAKLHGCRVIGVAGGPEKCRYVIDDLGFDDCIDYKADDFKMRYTSALPNGIDCLFENVGGSVFDVSLAHMNPFSRIALCGFIADFNASEPYGIKRLMTLIINRVKLQGFIVGDHPTRWPLALQELTEHVVAGRLRYRETIAEGLEAAPVALAGMFHGHNFGKQLVRVL